MLMEKWLDPCGWALHEYAPGAINLNWCKQSELEELALIQMWPDCIQMWSSQVSGSPCNYTLCPYIPMLISCALFPHACAIHLFMCSLFIYPTPAQPYLLLVHTCPTTPYLCPCSHAIFLNTCKSLAVSCSAPQKGWIWEQILFLLQLAALCCILHVCKRMGSDHLHGFTGTHSSKHSVSCYVAGGIH